MIKSMTRVGLLGFVLGCSPALTRAGDPLVESADEVLQQVIELRQLELREPISRGVKTRDEIKKYLIERIEKEYPREVLNQEERVLKILGLIPPDLNLYEFLLELLTEQLAGFYDPYQKSFYIADWIPAELQQPIMAHELTHALQDQHFDLKSMLKRVPGNDDITLARAAVIEGEGVGVMMDYLLKPLQKNFLDVPDMVSMLEAQQSLLKATYKVLASAPDYLREGVFFPYSYGANFIQHYRRSHSWPEVGKLYERLPVSTEQILHPEKYLSERDDPTALEPAASQGLVKDDSSRRYENVLGEFITFLLLKQYSDEATAREAAGGWDGDLIELFDNADNTQTLLIQTVWDSNQDARQFSEAYGKVVLGRYPQAENLSSNDHHQRWKTGTGEVQVALEGARVIVSEMVSKPEQEGGSATQPKE